MAESRPISTTFFEAEAAPDEALEDFEAAEEVDAGPLPTATPCGTPMP